LNLLSRILPLLLIALPLAGCAQNPAKPAYAPPDAGFSVQMPAPPREQQGQNGAHIYGCEANGKAYLVSYSELPAAVRSVSPERLLDAARDSLVRSGKASVTKEEKTTLDGRPARDMRLKTREGYYMRLKMVVSGSRLYQVGAVTAMDKSDAPEIDAFINSFHFTGK
jgi:hypothetical protein